MPFQDIVNGGIGVFFMVKEAIDGSRRQKARASAARELAEKVPSTLATAEPEESDLPTAHAVPEDPPEDSPTEDIVSGTSQISAAGKACIPCGNDHFSTASRVLGESLRFAREGGVNNPEVIERISAAEDELNAFERIDGDPEKVVKLPPDEKEVMEDMLVASRKMRHMLKEIVDVATLEQTAADVQKIKTDFRTKVFKMTMERKSSEDKEKVNQVN